MFLDFKDKIAWSQRSGNVYIKLHISLKHSFCLYFLFTYIWPHSKQNFLPNEKICTEPISSRMRLLRKLSPALVLKLALMSAVDTLTLNRQ